MAKVPFLRQRILELAQDQNKIDPHCALFGSCGGCTTLDLDYQDECSLKHQVFQELLDQHKLELQAKPLVPSPLSSGYRNKISPQFKTMMSGEFVFGMAPFGKKQVMNMEACPMAYPAISAVLPEVKKTFIAKQLPPKKRGCAVIRSDGDQLHWGGWGKGSLSLTPNDYFCFHHDGHNIYYSLDTFFQLNTSILTPLITHLKHEFKMCENTHFLDLYGGVGLFAISLGSSAKRTTLMELEGRSTTLAAYNKTANQLEHLDIVCGAVEETLPHLSLEPDENVLALIDPPRSGLKPNVIETLHEFRPQRLAYLSCNPETQLRDLAHFRRLGWTIESITPYDFFPRSYHIESLAFLSISNET